MSQCADRQKLIADKVRLEEEKAKLGTVAVKEYVLHFLKTEKGYCDEDIEIDKPYSLDSNNISETCSVDFIINIKGRRLMAIKCSLSSIESSQRHILSFSRVVEDYQLPYSIVTDGIDAMILDTATGKTVSENINDIPYKSELDIDKISFIALPKERLEKEKRILFAFQTVSCSMVPESE